jgi:uncharacterized membrane protein YedE/YeeE
MGFSRMENTTALAAYYIVFGLVLFASGAWVLRSYLRQNPAEKEVLPDEQ